MIQSQRLTAHLIIHSFALAHCMTAWLLFSTTFGDEIPLTILTIIMILTLTRVYETPMDVAAAIALLGCFAGFYLGNSGPKLIEYFTGNLGDWIHSVATLLITEIVGWITFVIVKRRKI